MRLIEDTTFPIAHELHLVALQGDCGLREETAAEGGRYVVDERDRARDACLSLVERARATHAHLALIPELVIPLHSLPEVIQSVEGNAQPLILIGGVEGISPTDYRALVTQYGGTPDVPDGAAGTYVNSLIVIHRTTTDLRVYWRAKRFASGPENAGAPQIALGESEFLVLRVGTTPFVIVPLICSEFVWPELWTRLQNEAPGLEIDVIPVLQRNHDIERRHLGPVIHTAYQRNLQTRFVFANQGLIGPGSDGTCYVVVPPAAPAAPGFDHGRHELWLPEGNTYKGFRIPERTGCVWSAQIAHRNGPMNATRPPVCAGRVLAVLKPLGVDLTGLAAGLMRSAASSRYLVATDVSTEPKDAYRKSLVPEGPTYILDSSSRTRANDCFFQMICDDRPTWSTVESLTNDLIDSAALLGSGGDRVRIEPCSGGNCSVSGRSVAVLYAPVVDSALAVRFSMAALLSGTGLPAGIILLKVTASSRSPRAKTVGDVLRADRVSSDSPELTDGPTRVTGSSVMIGLRDIHFCEPEDLRPNLEEATLIAARDRATSLLPGVYA